MERDTATPSTGYDAEHVRTRIALYIQILLIIDVVAHLSDVIALLVDGATTGQLAPMYKALRYTCTALMLSAWAIARFTRPRYLTLVALETAVTLSLASVYIMLGIEYLVDVAPDHGPTLSLIGIVMLISVRSALVPSRAVRTAIVGVIVMAAWIVVSSETLGGLERPVREGLIFMGGAIVVATSVTSHVIYGLREQVRDAKRLGQYELTRKLGEGGMGVVYRATHLMLRRPTAVKLLPVDRAGEDTVARFEREVVQTSRLEHPNSVIIYDYGRTPEGVFYYAMEYVDGLTLADLVAEHGPIESARAARILAQAARALAEAHALGLVHRDVKPANIMICERAGVADAVKVLDFGLVKAIDDPDIDAELTGADRIVGTPTYLAPEAITHPDGIGPGADVYALGAVGFYLLAGRAPFVGSTVVEVCSQHLHVEPEAPSAVRGEPIEAALEAVILACLAKAPADRPADGAALAAILDDLALEGWSDADAERWWRENGGGDRESAPPATPTQLAIDIGGR